MNNETENTAPATEALLPLKRSNPHRRPVATFAVPADPAVTARMAADPVVPAVTDAVAPRLEAPWKKAPAR